MRTHDAEKDSRSTYLAKAADGTAVLTPVCGAPSEPARHAVLAPACGAPSEPTRHAALAPVHAVRRAGGVRLVLPCSALLALFLALTIAVPTSAFAISSSSADSLREAFERAVNDPTYSPYSTQTDEAPQSNSYYPESFDLRDNGTVTSVKRQHPWGTCWSFASISAAETSLINSGVASADINLSERHLAWFAYTSVTEDEVGEAQAGEGYHTDSTDPNAVFDNGGQVVYATGLFASGRGPVSESLAPYQNDEGYITCMVLEPDADATATPTEQILTSYEIQCLRNKGYTVTCSSYSKTKPDGTAATWAVSDSLWNTSEYTLKESYLLPDTRILDADGDWAGLNQEGIDAVKDQLTQGRAVTVAFYADNSRSSETGTAKYLNTQTWAHFAWDTTGLNHAVTIVGWDDSYSKSNFLEGHQPEGDGAWLVKNSWGSEDEEFPNYGTWGLTDDEGNHTGYFWISYYDRSVQRFEAFDFESTASSSDTTIDQYDYLPQSNTYYLSSYYKWSTANEFTADDDRILDAVSCITVVPNATVTYDIYLLDDDDKTPDDGALVRSVTADYEYGGYHRYALAEDEQVAMREGQRYVVAVTQQCNTDGRYYINTSLDAARLSQDEVEEYRAAAESVYKNQYLDVLRRNKYQALIDQGVSKDEAKAQAITYIQEYQTSDEWKTYCETTLAENVENAVYNAQHSYYESRINAGESWLYSSDATGYDWDDWTDVIPMTGIEAAGWVTDNMPIKAFSTSTDWASTESLDELAAKVKDAQAALDAAVISAGGTDVEPSKTWITQAEHDSLAAAIASARELLERAGDYKSETSTSTPTQSEADEALAALDTSVIKPGTKGQGGGSGDEDEDKKGDSEKDKEDGNANKGGSALPQTGDAASLVPLACAALAGTASIARGIRRR